MSQDATPPPSQEENPRERIIQAAFKTVARHKLGGTTLRRIAAESGFSQGHIHYYFPDKTSLLLAVLDRMHMTFLEWRRAALRSESLDPPEKLKVFFDHQARMLSDSVELLQVRLDFLVYSMENPTFAQKIEQMGARLRAEIETVVAAGVGEGSFDPVHAPVIPDMAIALMEGALLQHIREGGAVDLDAYFSEAYEMVMRMLAAPGLARTDVHETHVHE